MQKFHQILGSVSQSRQIILTVSAPQIFERLLRRSQVTIYLFLSQS